MAARRALNPTMIGACAVGIWGCAVPIIKVVEDRVGLLAFMGLTYAIMAAFGVVSHAIRRLALPTGIFRNRVFYVRWLFFVLHDGLLTTGVFLVQRKHMPYVVLINYLWPTAIILCSVMLAGVRITRWWAFLLGSLVVFLSMVAELTGPAGIAADLFSRRRDCVAYLVVFAGALCWGMYSALSRRDGIGAGGAAVLPLFQSTLALALPVSFLPGMATWSSLTSGSAFLFVGYCFLLYLSFKAWDLGMRQGNVVILSLLADFIPWVSLASTSLMLHVALGSRAVISAIVLVAGAMIARFGTLQRTPRLAAYEEPGI